MAKQLPPWTEWKDLESCYCEEPTPPGFGRLLNGRQVMLCGRCDKPLTQ